MSQDRTIFVIDAGNTSIKVGHFQEDTLLQVVRYAGPDDEQFHVFLNEKKSENFVISSVLSDSDTSLITSKLANVLLVTQDTPTPLIDTYQSKTLGIDRLCNAVAIWKKMNSSYAVSVDIGTCVKFDLVNQEGEYLGGSISPGINLRYKSLNDYTGKLPLLSNKSNSNLVGKDTKTSIQSGVINGLQAEINGMMSSYSDQYSSLTFFVTGGDAGSFDIHSKNDIFADENLTLIGLFEIYKHNA